ncbi:hypothetical protein HMPREF1211_00042 [Streptomyces sp. HGB0020]|nr:hypothetical protein HMPREF1211_00042 [Streptomyces sp. HGB0020]
MAAGAIVTTGGTRLDGPGYFYAPTLVEALPGAARLLPEETFGPVAPVVSFDDEAEAIAQANDTDYGLASYIFTRDLDRGIRVAESLETGMVGLNAGVISNAAAPFGGIKASGFGREGGAEGIEESSTPNTSGCPSPPVDLIPGGDGCAPGGLGPLDRSPSVSIIELGHLASMVSC